MMLAGLALFLGPHVFSSLRPIRARLIARVGEGPYKGLYSILSLAGFALIVSGYAAWRAAGPARLWTPPAGVRPLVFLLMLGSALALGAYLVPSHLRARLRHPMLLSVMLWGLAHLLANGDAATVTLAAPFLLWAAYDRAAVSRRGTPAAAPPRRWAGDVGAVAAGLAVYAALILWFHPFVIGVPVLPP